MDWLSDMSDTGVERKSRLPSEKFFYPNSIEEEEEYEKARKRVESSPTVVLTDPDADGFGAAVAIRQKHPEASVVECGPHSRRLDLGDGLELVSEYFTGEHVYVVDICPDDIDALDELRAVADTATVHWWDHHEWEEGPRVFVRNRVDDFVLNEGNFDDSESPPEKCAAEVAVDELTSEGVTMSNRLQEAVTVIGVYDCWKRNDDDEFIDARAADLHDYAEVATLEEFEQAITTYGADVMEDESVRNDVKQFQEKNEKLQAFAVDRAEFVEIDVHDESEITDDVEVLMVAVTYGRCPTNETAEELREQGADLVIVVEPSGGVGLRGSDRFGLCHLVAGEFGGGGHEAAAGCFIPPKNDGDRDRFDTDMLDYAEHWLTNGEQTKQLVLESVKEIAQPR